MWTVCLLFLLSGVLVASLPNGLQPYYRSSGRIVGGQKMTIDEAPYQVAMVYYGEQFCGGTIITNDAILIAAHCLAVVVERFVKVRVGSTWRYSGGKLLPIRKMVWHENFTYPYEGNDVGLIWLAEPLVFSNTVKKISLPDKDANLQVGTLGLITGWGYLTDTGVLPNQLMGLEVPIVDRTICNDSLVTVDGQLLDGMFCAGYMEGGKDACSGDSGGPLMINNRVVGITSFGYVCALPNYPGIYTDVAYYLEWIQQKLSEDLGPAIL